MIFLDIKLEDFFEEYPVLKSQAEEYSKKHKFKVSEMKPYLEKDFIGVYGTTKDGCPVMISTPRSNQSNNVFTEVIKSLK